MGLVLVQKQSQKLKLTPALYQSMQILRCNTEELSRLIHEKAMENPLMQVSDHADRYDYFLPDEEKKSASEVIEEMIAESTDFRERLHRDLHQMKLSAGLLSAADLLIDSLNDRGLLEDDPKTILERFNRFDVKPESALAAVQALDPAGIGARSLTESLLLQLRRLEPRCSLAETILSDFSDCFLNEGWTELARLLGVTRKAIDQAIETIQTLNPYPLSGIEEDSPQYLIPDVLILKRGGDLICEIDDRYLPAVSVNSKDYTRYMENADAETKHYLKEKFEEVSWLLSGISRRRQTLMRLAHLIMIHQKDYFMTGKCSSLCPFTMKQAAEQLSIHESTVSRAAAGKYIQTNYGIFSMKKFFVRACHTKKGTHSAFQIQAEIKRLIDGENQKKPFSDQTLVQLLAESGIRCSRRVVAKYRQACGIGSTIERKEAN
ncbi:RNA polymerase factor sigma-54 [Sporolactobacillus sp. CPB3-1]|uniref:RNA polymerase factor sigma-54 n=1 Tax=Sporolactobacillus mangiferae TaxID=2940498 RepID=A0ABT0MBK3_9BACL|nr:RNA polymerase factor sigma-54 [Sporolactobacillus mangiferae]MCL1632251.1 RNA polymerase factor sigma-54 [Sporolactobacillus mangiferae]